MASVSPCLNRHVASLLSLRADEDESMSGCTGTASEKHLRHRSDAQETAMLCQLYNCLFFFFKLRSNR